MKCLVHLCLHREKYMGTILQLEVLLKVWFPQVTPHHRDGTSLHNPMASVQPRWNQDQLHIPVKVNTDIPI